MHVGRTNRSKGFMCICPEKHRDAIISALARSGYIDPVAWEPESDEEGVNEFLFQRAESIIGNSRKIHEVQEKIYFALVLGDEYQAAAWPINDTEYVVLFWREAYLRNISVVTHLVGSQTFAARFGTDIFDQAIQYDRKENVDIFLQEMALSIIEPHSEINTTAVSALSVSMFDFLILHEMGHILSGHVQSSAQLGQIKLMSERSSMSRERDSNLTSHALEYDADAYATQQLLTYAARAHSRFSDKLRDIERYEGLGWVAVPMIAISTVAKFLEYEVKNRDDLFLWDHPWGQLRAYMCWTTAKSVLTLEPFSFNIGPVTTVLDDCALVADHAIFDISRTGPNQVLTWTLEIKNEYTQRILQRWSKIRPILAPYLLGVKKLAPAQLEPA